MSKVSHRSVAFAASVALLLAAVSQPAQAQSQRMVIPILSGLKLGPEGAEELPSICLNLERPAPARGENLGRLLTPGDGGTVRVGDETYSLRDALSKGYVSIRGLGSARQFEIRNNTKKDLAIDTDSPGIVSGWEGDGITDFEDHADVLKGYTGDDSRFPDLQFQVWDMLGPRRDKRLGRLIDGAMSPDEYRKAHGRLDGELVALLGKEGEHRKAVFRSHNEYIVAGRNEGGEVQEDSLLLERGGDGALTAESAELVRHVQPVEFARAKAASTPDAAFLAFGVTNEPEKPTASQLGSSAVDLPSEALLKYYKDDGAPLPEELRKLIAASAAKRIVVWRSSYQRKDLRDRLKDWGKVVEKLQAQFPDKEFALDGNDEASLRKMAEQPAVKGGEDLAVYNDEKSLPQGYEAMITNLKEKFDEAKIKVVDPDADEVPAAHNVVVLSGLKNDDFRDLVDDLLFRGQLRGKIVVFLSCGEGQEDAYNSRLLSDPNGPTMILYYTERIDPEAVRRLLARLPQALGDQANKANVQSLLRKAIDAEIDRAREQKLGQDFIDKLEQLKKLIPQLSMGDFGPRSEVRAA